MDTTLIFVRHGQSEANTKQYFAGHYDAPLTAIGLAQAKLMADYVVKHPISAIYASDLSRATDTALPIAHKLSISICKESRFREINAGVWQKMDFEHLLQDELYLEWRKGTVSIAPDDGESMEELFARVNEATEEIVSKHTGKTVVIVTHATPIRVLKTRWLGLPLSELFSIESPPNASVTIVKYRSQGTQEITEYGENRFLGKLSSAATTQM